MTRIPCINPVILAYGKKAEATAREAYGLYVCNVITRDEYVESCRPCEIFLSKVRPFLLAYDARLDETIMKSDDEGYKRLKQDPDVKLVDKVRAHVLHMRAVMKAEG